jgi:o-succinylbenzoate synthase
MTRRSLHRLSVPLRTPFVTATGVVSTRELLLLRVEDEDGLTGHGEAAPFEPYDGTPFEVVAAALREGVGPGAPPQARAAEEMARLDLEARRAGRTLGEPGADVIAVNRTLGAGPPEEVALRAAEGVKAGYSCFKLKVGLEDDLDRVAAVREVIGPWPALRVDANGAWSASEAVKRLEAFAPYDLQWAEQPCRTLRELAEVRRSVPVPVAADEPIASADDVRTAARELACDVVCVKLGPSGGFTGARSTLRAAAEQGLQACLTSTLDGPWGIAAALQLAASERISLACGLATLELFAGPLARVLPPPRQGLMPVPQGPGLGVQVDEELFAGVAVEQLA